MVVGYGEMNGADNGFTPDAGDMTGSDPGALPQGGGNGPPPAAGQTQGPPNSAIDGMTCDASMYSGPVPPGYHVHAFLGLYVNGQEIAIPRGVGMDQPGAPRASYGGVPNQTEDALCFYDMHTHDPSGVIHIESSNPNNVPLTGSMYTLGNFLDIWGIATGPNQFGPYTGPMTIYTTGDAARGHSQNGYVYNWQLSQYTGDVRQIPLYSHTVVWVMIGTGNPTPATLPNIEFYEMY